MQDDNFSIVILMALPILLLLAVAVVAGLCERSMLNRGEQLNLPRYRILKYWRDDLAKYHYKLQETDFHGLYYQNTGQDGNFKWAERQAKHYECKIIKEDEEDNEC